MKLAHIAVQNVVGVLALCISIVAAIFAWQQVEISRVHNRLSVAPILHVTPYAEGKSGRSGIYVSNVGLGPAIIKEFSVKAGGVVASGFESDQWPEILTAADTNPLCFATAWPKADSAVKAGEELPLVFVTKAEGSDICYAELIKLIGGQGVDISIQYESIYGEPRHVSESFKVKSKTMDWLYRQFFGK